MTASGRKRTLVLPDFGVSERPLSGKAACQISSITTAQEIAAASANVGYPATPIDG